MANYALTVNPQFTPFTYDQLVKPVQAYQEVYDKYSNDLNSLQEKSASLEKLALSAQDQDTYLKYKSYADEVNRQIESLSKNGLSSSTRTGFQNVRKQYNTEITPIEEAIKTREELIKRQQSIYDKDETALFDRDASQIKLSDIMANPTMDFQHYSGLKLRSQMEASMKAFADELNGPMKNVGNAQLKAHYGFTREEINAALQNPYDPNSQNVINKIANQILEGSGILSWDTGNEESNKALQDQAYNYIMQGAYAGIGKDQLVENYNARHAAENSKYQPIEMGGGKWMKYTEKGFVIGEKDEKGKFIADVDSKGMPVIVAGNKEGGVSGTSTKNEWGRTAKQQNEITAKRAAATDYKEAITKGKLSFSPVIFQNEENPDKPHSTGGLCYYDSKEGKYKYVPANGVVPDGVLPKGNINPGIEKIDGKLINRPDNITANHSYDAKNKKNKQNMIKSINVEEDESQQLLVYIDGGTKKPLPKELYYEYKILSNQYGESVEPYLSVQDGIIRLAYEPYNQ